MTLLRNRHPAAWGALIGAALGLSACGPDGRDPETPGTPCLDFPAGSRFEAQLTAVYDATSDYYYDPELVNGSLREEYNGRPCEAPDGLAVGSRVGFTTGRYSPARDATLCSYREMTEVTGVGVHAGQYAMALPGTPGVLAFAWTREAIVADTRVDYDLLVLAPGGDLWATPVRGELPPALLVRALDGCALAWVAELTEVAP